MNPQSPENIIGERDFGKVHPASIQASIPAPVVLVNNNNKEFSPQLGGLYLKNLDKKGFKPILDMIVHPDSTVKMLTYDSLKGFMIVLNINEQNSEYNYLSETSPRKFTRPVTDFLLKLSVITKKEKNLGRIENPSKKSSASSSSSSSSSLEDGDIGILKYSETMDSFIEEAKIQQKIWYTSLSNSKDQLCPSIANFSIFTNKNSRRLINILNHKTKDEVLKHVLNWINKLFIDKNDSEYELGIITMPLIQNSSTFNKYLDLYENSKVPRRDFLMSIESFLIQLLRLWIDHRIYHADLHTNNSLIYKNNDGEIKCVLIDFGKIIDFTTFISKYKDEDGLTSDFFDFMNKRMDEKIHKLGFKLLDKYDVGVAPLLTRSQKIDGIDGLYTDFYAFDSRYYKKVYGLVDGNSYDYYKVISSLKPSVKNMVFESVYDKLYKMYSIIDKHGEDQNIDFFIKNKKRFFFIDTRPNNYYYYNLYGYDKDIETDKYTKDEIKKKKRKNKIGRKTAKKRKGKGFLHARTFKIMPLLF